LLENWDFGLNAGLNSKFFSIIFSLATPWGWPNGEELGLDSVLLSRIPGSTIARRKQFHGAIRLGQNP